MNSRTLFCLLLNIMWEFKQRERNVWRFRGHNLLIQINQETPTRTTSGDLSSSLRGFTPFHLWWQWSTSFFHVLAHVTSSILGTTAKGPSPTLKQPLGWEVKHLQESSCLHFKHSRLPWPGWLRTGTDILHPVQFPQISLRTHPMGVEGRGLWQDTV